VLLQAQQVGLTYVVAPTRGSTRYTIATPCLIPNLHTPVVRLYGVNSRLSGLVQFISFTHSNSDARQWNYVCDDRWDINAAKVVCRQLGLGPPVRTGLAQPFPDDGLTHRYVMDNVDCEGTEQYLSDCTHLFDGYNFTLSDCIGSSVTCGCKIMCS